jgi:hypothetical protein
MTSRRDLLRAVVGSAGAAAPARTQNFDHIGLRADTGSPRSECGVGALMPWAVTYNKLRIPVARQPRQNRG